jgi:hypothetical protein
LQWDKQLTCSDVLSTLTIRATVISFAVSFSLFPANTEFEVVRDSWTIIESPSRQIHHLAVYFGTFADCILLIWFKSKCGAFGCYSLVNNFLFLHRGSTPRTFLLEFRWRIAFREF